MRRSLNLSRETLSDLTPADLVHVVGGAGSEDCPPSYTCPSNACETPHCGPLTLYRLTQTVPVMVDRPTTAC